MDMTISKKRYCSKETVKERKFGSVKASDGVQMLQNIPQIPENIKTQKKPNQTSNKTQMFLQNKKRGASLKDLLNRVDQDQTSNPQSTQNQNS